MARMIFVRGGRWNLSLAQKRAFRMPLLQAAGLEFRPGGFITFHRRRDSPKLALLLPFLYSAPSVQTSALRWNSEMRIRSAPMGWLAITIAKLNAFNLVYRGNQSVFIRKAGLPYAGQRVAHRQYMSLQKSCDCRRVRIPKMGGHIKTEMRCISSLAVLPLWSADQWS